MTSLAARPPTPTFSDHRRWLPLPVMLAALFVITLDFFIVNVALPSMQADLNADRSAVQLWVAAYAVTFGALIILGGRLGDVVGRRRMFVAGLALFTAASAACGVAPDPSTLIAARVAQGVGAALLSPQILATIGVVYTGQDRVKAITAYGLTAGLAAVTGQLIGGALIEIDVAGLGWRSCFLVNVPLGIVAMALAPRLVPESRAPHRAALDVPSVVLVTAGLGAVVLPLIEGREQGWPAWTIASLVGAAILLTAFARRQLRLARTGRAPLIDPALATQRGLAVGALTTLVFQLTVASSFFVLALELQDGLSLDPLESGLVFTILAVGYLITSVAAPALEARIGSNSLIIGALISAGGWAGLAVAAPSAHTAAALAPALFVAGLGMGLLFGPLVGATLATVSAESAGSASGLVNTVSQVGGAVGVALLGIVFYGSVGSGSPTEVGAAFGHSMWCLAGVALAVGALARLLPAPRIGSGT